MDAGTGSGHRRARPAHARRACLRRRAAGDPARRFARRLRHLSRCRWQRDQRHRRGPGLAARRRRGGGGNAALPPVPRAGPDQCAAGARRASLGWPRGRGGGAAPRQGRRRRFPTRCSCGASVWRATRGRGRGPRSARRIPNGPGAGNAMCPTRRPYADVRLVRPRGRRSTVVTAFAVIATVLSAVDAARAQPRRRPLRQRRRPPGVRRRYCSPASRRGAISSPGPAAAIPTTRFSATGCASTCAGAGRGSRRRWRRRR